MQMGFLMVHWKWGIRVYFSPFLIYLKPEQVEQT